jgi:hypothetical protein
MSEMDIEGYQCVVDGKDILVKDMTKEQLQIALCKMIILLEYLDSDVTDLKSKLDLWRDSDFDESDLRKIGKHMFECE